MKVDKKTAGILSIVVAALVSGGLFFAQSKGWINDDKAAEYNEKAKDKIEEFIEKNTTNNEVEIKL